MSDITVSNTVVAFFQLQQNKKNRKCWSQKVF